MPPGSSTSASLRPCIEGFLYADDVLVASSRQVHEQDLIALHRRRQPADMRDGVRRLERRQNPLLTRQTLERVERGRVIDPRVLGSRRVVEPRVLGTDGGVVEA